MITLVTVAMGRRYAALAQQLERSIPQGLGVRPVVKTDCPDGFSNPHSVAPSRTAARREKAAFATALDGWADGPVIFADADCSCSGQGALQLPAILPDAVYCVPLAHKSNDDIHFPSYRHHSLTDVYPDSMCLLFASADLARAVSARWLHHYDRLRAIDPVYGYRDVFALQEVASEIAFHPIPSGTPQQPLPWLAHAFTTNADRIIPGTSYESK